jgi:predicted RNase H-like HicB family nuclease
MTSYNVGVVIEKDDYGYYAFCPELEGCQTQGDTFEEVIANIREAVDLYVDTMPEDEMRERLSREILTTTLEGAVA